MTTSVQECIEQIQKTYTVIDIVNCSEFKNNWIRLYSKINALHKQSFAPNERIIFLIDSEIYGNKLLHGLVLHSLQKIINDVDISNFFCCVVSTNPDIHDEYQEVLKEHSIDPVSMHIFSCIGEFTKTIDKTFKPFLRMQNMQAFIRTIDQMDERQQQLLFENNVFCLAPWTSIMVDTDSTVKPCCEYIESVGDSSIDSLEQVWNQPALRKVRQSMLQGKKVSGCESCYKKELYGRDSLRNSFNRRFSKNINKVNNTKPNGEYSEFELVYLDARFNNLCNLSCRSCNHVSSSSWHKPATQLGLIAKDTPVFLSGGRHKNDIFDQIKTHTESLESIYFAGGEPLIIDEFYNILDWLDKNNKHDIELVYNTNMTKTKIKDKNIFDAWKNFKNISIGASLDAEGTRAEYLRCGTKWQDVLDFRQELMLQRPDIDFYISATTSIINVLHVPDFHKSWVEQGLIRAEQFNIQSLFSPDYMAVDTAPPELKEKIKTKYTQHLSWLRPLDPLGRATYGFESILNQIEKNVQFDRHYFWSNIKLLDGYHKTNLLTTFPELEDLK